MFYSFAPNTPAQKAIGQITNQTCDRTEIVYMRNQQGFLGIITQVETTKDQADYSFEKCVQ